MRTKCLTLGIVVSEVFRLKFYLVLETPDATEAINPVSVHVSGYGCFLSIGIPLHKRIKRQVRLHSGIHSFVCIPLNERAKR
jgi:hypothetical protein